MNFLLIIIYGYAAVAGLLVFFIVRDAKKENLFFNRHYRLAFLSVALLIFSVIIAFYSTLIEPFLLKQTFVNYTIKNLSKPIKIAFVSDIQVGQWKKTAWVKKITEKIMAAKPDLVILGGDLIDNEGTFEDETRYLEPLKKLAENFPIYYILGNHEYGIGGKVRTDPSRYTGDRSADLITRLNQYGFKLLRNSLDCPEIQKEKICLFGLDDIWKNLPDFSPLENLPTSTPLILITHNPDGILYYPNHLPPPDLVLAGHAHGGQIWLPWIGPLGDAQIALPDSYYKGTNSYKNIPVFVSTGAGESGAPLRLFAIPEIVLVNLVRE